MNGLRFSQKASYLSYTSTVLKLFMRVRVDRQTLAPLGVPEYLGGDKMMDDFCIDEEAGVAYVASLMSRRLALSGETTSVFSGLAA